MANDFTKSRSLRAVERLCQSLETNYTHGDNLEARLEVLKAAYEAGVAFARANVGYVHNIAHQFGALFGTPHGVANAMTLPHVLEFYASNDDTCTEELAKLAVAAGLGSPYENYTLEEQRVLARRFIEHLRGMNLAMSVPDHVPEMKASDVATVVQRAMLEGRTFPVPKQMPKDVFTRIVTCLLPPSERASSKL